MLKRYKCLSLFLFSVVFLVAGALSAFAAADKDIYFNVNLLDGNGTAKIHAGIYKNPNPYQGFLTVLAVHGLTEVGSMYEPLAKAIFADPALKHVVKRVVAIDLPGKGKSSAPSPVSQMFGNLLIEDNILVIIQVISQMRASGHGPQVVIGHSMGGLALQGAQEMLLSKGSSLAKLGVYSAVLMAAVPAYGATWTQLPGADVSAYIGPDATLGYIFNMPVAMCGYSGGFTPLSNPLSVIPAAPSPQTCIANGWMGPEPAKTLFQLVGGLSAAYGINRPYARPKAFELKNGTALTVIGFSQDVLAPIVDQPGLYTYLTGLKSDGPFSLYRPVVAADAVHSMFVSNPTGMLHAVRCGIR